MERIKKTNYIAILVCAISFLSNSVSILYGQENVKIEVFTSFGKADFNLLNSFDSLNSAPVNSAFHVSTSRPEVRELSTFNIPVNLLGNGDSTITLKDKTGLFIIKSHFKNALPSDSWEVYDSDNLLRAKYIFICGVNVEIIHFDKTGKVFDVVQYPNDPLHRIEKWYSNNICIRSDYSTCNGFETNLFYENGNLAWKVDYNNNQRFTTARSYDSKGVFQHEIKNRALHK